ncbi:MAG: nucleotidyltransferase domain-containing protein [Duncaniella sp.]|nr:nucleotidyltransferase domain-containing protein [Duncaniella sp.]
MKLIEMNMDKIIALCRKYKVDKLWVFGSILTPRFNDMSDVDFSVNFDADTINNEGLDWADIFFDFIHELETLLGRRVDMICDSAVQNPSFRRELNKTRRLLYDLTVCA